MNEKSSTLDDIMDNLALVTRFIATTRDVLQIQTNKEFDEFLSKQGVIVKCSYGETAKIAEMISDANKLLDSEGKENFKSFLKTKGIEVNTCLHCNKLIIEEGIEDDEYYCSDECIAGQRAWEEYQDRFPEVVDLMME